MLPSPAPAPLTGRQEQIGSIKELIGAAAQSRGGALVLRGEAGIGKSALLEHARQTAPGFRVIRTAGSEFESELPYAALHQLCRPLLSPEGLGELPAQHRDVLQVAFGIAIGQPDFFRVGLATLELLAVAAHESPLLCLVDDAHWLDPASLKVLTFVARRIPDDSVAVLIAARTPGTPDELDTLPGIELGGLDDAQARSLLAANSRITLDDQVRDRLLAEARGNPLALLQLPRTDGFAVPDTSSVPSRIERSFQARLADLPAGARLLLTIASADPTGDPALLWPAAQRLGIDVPAASTTATVSGLAEFATRVRFCHPLARSAVYLAADDTQRRTAHRVLADVTDPATDPDRHAWHRARAGAGPDEEVATELEQAAARALSRGGVIAAADLIERSAALSLDPAKRIERTLAAVQAKLDAGVPDAAADLLATVGNSAAHEPRLDLLRGQIAFARRDGGDGPMFVIRAGQRLATQDPEQSRRCFLDALEMSLAVGRAQGVMGRVLEAAEAASTGRRSPDILDALTVLTTDGHAAAVPLIRKILEDVAGPLWTDRPGLTAVLAAELWDLDTHAALVTWLMKTGRASGSPLVLRLGLAQLASNSALTGDLVRATTAIAEEEAIADAIGAPRLVYHRLHLAAMRGRREEATELFEAAAASEELSANLHWAAAVLNNGLADYPAALVAARLATSQDEIGLAGFALPELVEAAVRCGEAAEAATALEELTARTGASGTAVGLGIAAYARGLVTGVEEHYREAIDRLEGSPALPYRARAHLLYGEWLRREGRRKDCREHLATAYELLSGAGLEAFAQRAAGELRATGERARRRTGHTYDELTPQELHIARLVSTGATSNEVAARLFISPRTVDTHLGNIYRKLGISSRRQLRDRPDLVGPS
ncbi:ATP-binding protein [Kribbella italica]|uniref:DNA-binding CsgD family transcriptional regulator n=1 Tax=Kribbella italica TaxID=1540520 RepID=A0A7W9MSU5_9ACTN|nr:LuxR family transcriptional regulator [Kribbella italica]MBB5834465.1 DNA-binding CsgD family transcriptional regulator [Kribbella italica]